MSCRPVCLLLLLLVATVPPAPAAGDDSLVLRGARVLDPRGERWLDGRTVLIVDGRIDRIASAGSIEAPTGARTIDLEGLYLLPGLIDLHSHLLLHPYDETAWDDQVLRESLGLRTLRGSVAARATLAAGFTTLRDLGTEGAGFADVALRDAIAQGIIDGPRVLASTRAIVAEASYGPSGFDPRWTLPKGAQEANGVDGVRRAVREQIAAGADWIKVYADYRRRSGAPSTPTFSQQELDALVAEARSAGVPVAAHASTDEGIRRAVLAGVSTIEHGSGASLEMLELMREHGVVLCPTLAASEAIARYAGWEPGDAAEPARVRASREMFTRALRSGVTIAMGSDVGVFDHGENVREIELMVAYGMSATDALASATSVAAGVLGHDDLGALAPGYRADLIAVRNDPLADPSALRDPVLVVKHGEPVKTP